MAIPWNKGKTKKEFPQLSLSGAKKGNKSWNKGKRGYTNGGSFTKGHKQSNTGKTHFKKGMMPWNKGKRFSVKKRYYDGSIEFPCCENCKIEVSRKSVRWCKKCSIIFQKHVGPKWEKGTHPFLGKRHSEETKKKISIAKTGKNLSEGTKIRMSKWRINHSEIMKKIGLKGLLKQQFLKEPTSIEKRVYEELQRRGLLFEKQKLINGKFLVDVYIPSLNLVIECDGDYWHSLDRVQKKDKAENAYLQKCGFNLLRLSEKEINNGNFIERLVD